MANAVDIRFLDPALPMAERVRILVSQMTLREKIAQLLHAAPPIPRLHVPAYTWWNECLHGVGRAGRATVFPQGVGMAASFNAPLVHRIATAISEITRNVVQHAGAPGQVSFLLEQTPERRGLRIVVEDHGRGIEPNERGKSDASLGLGAGIPGTQRLMDEFEIDSRPGGGTRISMVKWLPPADGGIADHT